MPKKKIIPGADVYGAVGFRLLDDEVEILKEEKPLQKLLNDGKLFFDGESVWLFEEDAKTLWVWMKNFKASRYCVVFEGISEREEVGEDLGLSIPSGYDTLEEANKGAFDLALSLVDAYKQAYMNEDDVNGHLRVLAERLKGIQVAEVCPHCNGYGSSLKDPQGIFIECSRCGGVGYVELHTGGTKGG